MNRPPGVARAVARIAGLCLLFAFPASQPGAQGSALPEYAVKSALLFKLPQFIYRPEAERNASLGMCLLGSNPFGNALEKLAQTPVDGRAVKLMKLTSPASAAECDFIFISRSEAAHVESLLARIGRSSLVTVSDIPGFARVGGMVELALGGEAGGVSILINRKAAQKQNVEFNAQLLRLAKVIEP